MTHVHPHDALADPLPFVMRDTSPLPVGCSGLAFRECIQPTLTARATWTWTGLVKEERNFVTAPRVGETSAAAPATDPGPSTGPGPGRHPHRFPQQHGPGLRHQAPAVSRHHDASSTCTILHGKSAFDSWLIGP